VAQEKPERSGGTEQSLADAGGRQTPPLQQTTLPWVIWAVATALAYTIIDWRMTKHLMPLLLPLHLAPALWAGRAAVNRYAVQAVFVALMAWNLYTLHSMSDDPESDKDFKSLQISPSW